MNERSIDELEEKIGESRHLVEGLAVEAGKVEEWARAIKNDNPAHRDETAAREQGFDRIPAPLTFLRVSLFPRYRPEDVDGEDHFLPHYFDIDFDPRYTVNGEVSFEFERPVYVGDVLSGVTTIADIYQREGSRGGTMTFVVFKTEYRDEEDSLVGTVRVTLIETEGAIQEGDDD